MKKNLYKILVFTCFALIIMQCFSYGAKKDNPFERQEFDKPISDDKSLHAENTIIDANKYNEYNPLNPIPAGVDKEEYDSVDNYIIDLKTLDSRIKYFSPAYLNVKMKVEAGLWAQLYVRGGSSISSSVFDKSLDEGREALDELREARRENVRQLINEKKNNPTSSRIADIQASIDAIEGILKTQTAVFNQTRNTLILTQKMYGHKNALYNIGNVDNNTNATTARRTITKTFRSLVLNYLKLKSSVEVLKESYDLQKKIYDVYLNQYENGMATTFDVTDLITAKKTYHATNTLLKNVKEQICINLGYDLSDIDKLIFIEPEVDMDYIVNINLDDDRDRAYNSNNAYKNIQMSSKDKKLPGSTGENIFNSERKYMAEKIIVGLEDNYQKLQAALWTYDGSMKLAEIVNINDEANERKKTQNLLSDVNYNGLVVMNLSNKLQVKNAKYDLIIASDNYYYATMGDLSIS